ncbi:mRNA capping enzyme subunit alpha [Spraguea lophii 42_110]|uniref:mRNA guanylyltransferase n=1 Tax=Spraguea lophii (strain 42_110) TaxID=1358809 RepID=S7XJV5_SPRLO|nr:mRNA capping enzyme subunit alpha [Spraguea lophii 42_110]
MCTFDSIGKLVPQKDTLFLLRKIYDIIQKKRTGDNFPGMHPVTFHRYHFPLLLKEDFLVCEKSDGLRLQLFVVNIKDVTHLFFYDRKLAFYKIPFNCKIPEDYLFDVEFLVENDNVHFLVFDTLVFKNKQIFKANLLERLTMAQSFVKLLQNINFPIKTTIKRMYKSYGIVDAYKNNTQSVETDGLIFTPINEPYSLGSSKKLLKWKPPHLNTIDFLIKNTHVKNIYKLYCYTKEGKEVFFDYFIDINEAEQSNNDYGKDSKSNTNENISEKGKRKLEEESPKKQIKIEENKDYDNKIGEFTFDKEKHTVDITDGSIIKGCWALYKIREDKKRPNPIRIVVNILESMEDEVEYNDFLCYVKDIRNNWKEREKVANKK